MLCFFTTLAIGHLPPFDVYCVLITVFNVSAVSAGSGFEFKPSGTVLKLVSQHSSIHGDGRTVMYEAFVEATKRSRERFPPGLQDA